MDLSLPVASHLDGHTEALILRGRVNVAISLIRHRRLACGDLTSRDVTVILRALEGTDVVAEAGR